MPFLELIPITTLLQVLTTEILETAVAAQDVLMEKETFKLLGAYFKDIQPVLSELRLRNLGESQAARQALDSLQEDIRKAKSLVEMCTKKSRFYQLVHCRSIVKEAQQVIRDVGKSLALLSLASTEVSVDIRDNVEKLRTQMLRTEFQASEQKLEVLNKIELGITQNRTDQGFVNDLINEIARAVGVPVQDSEIRKELSNLKREKEEAAVRKEREEEVFMEQVIALLSRADAARTPEDIREDYTRFQDDAEEELQPLQSFLCPISGEVMRDPVSVATGHTYERSRIQEWFDRGERTNYVTKLPLPDLTLKPNHKIKATIEEWVERNYCIRIRSARKKLESGDEAVGKQALEDLCKLCTESSKITHWIAKEGLVPLIVRMLESHDREVKKKCLSALLAIVTGNDENKRQLLDTGGVEQVVRCLARNISVSKLAVALLRELIQPSLPGKPFPNSRFYNKLSQDPTALLLLVTLLNGGDVEAAQNATEILEELCDKDQNIVEMAKVNWYIPLMDRLRNGSNESKLIMAKCLAELQLTELNKQSLGEGGAISSLVQMVPGNLEGKAAALKALQNLSTFGPNKSYIAEAGAIPLVLEHLFSGRFPVHVRESAAIILENMVLNEGTRFLVDANGGMIDQRKTIQDLLVVQDNSSSSSSVQKHVLLSLLGLVSPPGADEARKFLKDASGVSGLLPLLEGSDHEVRDVVVQVLCCLSDDSAQEITKFLIHRKVAGVFVNLLYEGRRDVQAAAAGILANLPFEEDNLTAYLVEESVIPAIVHVLKNGSPKSKESAAGALLRFTLPSNVELQQKVVELGVYDVLKGLINSGTSLGKVRAADAFRNFSNSTLRLSIPPSRSGCFCLLKRLPPPCKVHLGPCEERTTFCLVEANVVPDLLSLLNEQETASAGMDALLTLILEDEVLEKGAKHLHEVKAIDPILELMSQSTESCKEKAMIFLERIFQVKKMAECYGDRARILLVELASHGNSSIRRRAATVLARLQVIQEASTYF